MDDNEREALRLVKESATVHDAPNLPPWLIILGILISLGVGGFFLHRFEPCFFVRVKWWMSAEASVRHCVWQAGCSKDDEGAQLDFGMESEECKRFSRDYPIPHF